MAAAPPASVPTVSPAEIEILISRAGLVLNPGQVADLVLAWRQVAGLIAAIPRDRPLADDMALTFRLAPPVDAEPAAPPRSAKSRPTTTRPAASKSAAEPAKARPAPRGSSRR
jgi:hypothetical protein